MIFEYDERKYELHRDPTLRAVEAVTVFDSMLKLAYIDASVLTEGDLQKSPDEILDKQLAGKPQLLAQYEAKISLAEHIRTIMLCTGLSEGELQDAPLGPLFDKCCEVMGGTASDFFLQFMKSSLARKSKNAQTLK